MALQLRHLVVEVVITDSLLSCTLFVYSWAESVKVRLYWSKSLSGSEAVILLHLWLVS